MTQQQALSIEQPSAFATDQARHVTADFNLLHQDHPDSPKLTALDTVLKLHRLHATLKEHGISRAMVMQARGSVRVTDIEQEHPATVGKQDVEELIAALGLSWQQLASSQSGVNDPGALVLFTLDATEDPMGITPEQVMVELVAVTMPDESTSADVPDTFSL